MNVQASDLRFVARLRHPDTCCVVEATDLKVVYATLPDAGIVERANGKPLLFFLELSAIGTAERAIRNAAAARRTGEFIATTRWSKSLYYNKVVIEGPQATNCVLVLSWKVTWFDRLLSAVAHFIVDLVLALFCVVSLAALARLCGVAASIGWLVAGSLGCWFCMLRTGFRTVPSRRRGFQAQRSKRCARVDSTQTLMYWI